MSHFPPSISALQSIFRQNKVLIGKGTELVLLSYNDMTVLDLQVTFEIFVISVHFSVFFLVQPCCECTII
jgi:hypothetical protein